MTRLAGRSALITGVARGIGRALEEGLVQKSARVTIADVEIDRAQQSAAVIGEAAIAADLDVTRQDSIDSTVAQAAGTLGQTGILVNNAAIFSAAPIVEFGRADHQCVFDINASETRFTLRTAARHLIACGGGGEIITMASQAVRRGEPLVATNCATKAAVISLTQSAGRSLIQHGIRVNAIGTGVVEGEHMDGVDVSFAKDAGNAPDQRKREVGQAVPLGRTGRADELTGMAVFPASEMDDHLVAQCYNANRAQWAN